MLGRLKFDIELLVEEILDQLPSEVWSSSTTKFLDPAIGGGQFVQAVERRLRDAGHSDENIASRVYGYESNRMRINFAVNKYKLVGIYTNADFLEENIDMKFDVIVGNPPYQESKDHGKKVTGNGALWVKFTLKSIELCKDNGYVAFIIPDSWTAPTYDLMGSRKSIFNDYFKKYNLIYINFNVKKYFAGVGTDPSAFVLKKDSNYLTTSVITPSEKFNIDVTNTSFITRDVNSIALSIHEKVLNQNENNRLCKMRWTKNVTSIKTENEKSKEYCHPFVDHHAGKPLRWANTLDPDALKRKILIPYVGKYQCIIDSNGELGARESVSVLFLNDNETYESANSFFNSKLVTYIMNTNKWTQYVLSQIINYIPINDYTKVWTDNELYAHFNLTQEEINYIEQYN